MEIGSYIHSRRKELGYSLKEIAEKVGVSEGTVSRWESGFIQNMRRDKIFKLAQVLNIKASSLVAAPDKESNGTITKEDNKITNVTNVPIIGTIACGLPILAEENVTGYWPVPTMLLRSKDKHFILQAQGDSMTGSRIFDGDYVLIRCQNTAENGQIVAALVNGDSEATLKRIKFAGDMVLLEATNPEFETQVYKAKDVRIQGVAVSNIIPRL